MIAVRKVLRSTHIYVGRVSPNAPFGTPFCHCEATLGSRGNLVRHEITTPHEMRLVMTEESRARFPIRAAWYSFLSLRGDPWEPWQSIFCIAFVGLVFRPVRWNIFSLVVRSFSCAE